jgi:hypothetical protein
LGTPHEKNWPDALKLEAFKKTFPKFLGKAMEKHCPTLDALEIDLLTHLVKLDPNKRITAK